MSAWDNFAFNLPNITYVISNKTRAIPAAAASKITTTTTKAATFVLNY